MQLAKATLAAPTPVRTPVIMQGECECKQSRPGFPEMHHTWLPVVQSGGERRLSELLRAPRATARRRWAGDRKTLGAQWRRRRAGRFSAPHGCDLLQAEGITFSHILLAIMDSNPHLSTASRSALQVWAHCTYLGSRVSVTAGADSVLGRGGLSSAQALTWCR